MADFSAEVTAWCNRAGAHATTLLRIGATDMVNRVKELTPVDTGFLRSNWTALKRGDPEPVAGRVADPARTLAEIKIGDVVEIINPTVYARRIEYGFTGEDKSGRQYNQQGHHMAAQTVAEAPAIFDRALARLTGR